MTAAYASIPSPSIAEVPDGDPIEITFSIQKYKIPPSDPELNFLNLKKDKFPIFDAVDTGHGLNKYIYNLSRSSDCGFILKYGVPTSQTYARATRSKTFLDDVVVDHIHPPRRSHHEIIDYKAIEAIEALKKASSHFRPRRKKLPKSGKKVGKKSGKKSGKVRKNKRKTTL
jgi:hypothetical protein